MEKIAEAASKTMPREEFWRRALARQRQSGLSVRAFCAAEGLAPATFYLWKRRLRRPVLTLSPPKRIEFAPVRVEPENTAGIPSRQSGPSPDPAASRPSPAGRMEILLPSQCRIRLSGSVDRQQLATVLSVLEAQAC